MLPSECVSKKSTPRIKVSEKGRVLIIENPDRGVHTIVIYDGCCVSHKLAADYVIQDECGSTLIVELKGRSVEHGFSQVSATAADLLAGSNARKPVGALIVARQCPRISTIIQRAKADFRKRFGGRLSISSGDASGPLASFL